MQHYKSDICDKLRKKVHLSSDLVNFPDSLLGKVSGNCEANHT